MAWEKEEEKHHSIYMENFFDNAQREKMVQTKGTFALC